MEEADKTHVAAVNSDAGDRTVCGGDGNGEGEEHSSL